MDQGFSFSFPLAVAILSWKTLPPALLMSFSMRVEQPLLSPSRAAGGPGIAADGDRDFSAGMDV